MVYNIKKSEELFKLKLSVVCVHGIETHSAINQVFLERLTAPTAVKNMFLQFFMQKKQFVYKLSSP